ncbi:MAG: HAMP domain-containing histidine kinase [gamma proteobacterium symbiont of Taylorina sp.]|nr:HAMP domain-containing histidine kinase [gamma proteobacterium symbiont of Taylorina sp.]
MSHELRTPMNAVIGFSELLIFDHKSPITGNQRESVGEIIKAGKHLLNLINEVLDLSKIEAGHADLKIESVDVKELISQIYSLIQPQAEQQSITLENKVIDDTCFKVSADRTKLQQILLNFSSNAIKYNSDNGRLTFLCRKTSQNKIRVSVSDTGNGVPEELLADMFEPFNRLNRANLNVQGTGIGLTICKQLVELMGGEIGVFKNRDKGLTFWVEFKEIYT